MSILFSVTIHTIIKIGLLLFCEVNENANPPRQDASSEVRSLSLVGETVSPVQNTYFSGLRCVGVPCERVHNLCD
jgi:hypothetical protein